MIEKIHIIITLLASVIVTIVSIIQENDILLLSFRLIFTIVLFYVLGTVVKSRLKKIFEEELYEGLEIYNVKENNADTDDADIENENVAQPKTSHIE